jgi:hypothetical protein
MAPHGTVYTIHLGFLTSSDVSVVPSLSVCTVSFSVIMMSALMQNSNGTVPHDCRGVIMSKVELPFPASGPYFSSMVCPNTVRHVYCCDVICLIKIEEDNEVSIHVK